MALKWQKDLGRDRGDYGLRQGLWSGNFGFAEGPKVVTPVSHSHRHKLSLLPKLVNIFQQHQLQQISPTHLPRQDLTCFFFKTFLKD